MNKEAEMRDVFRELNLKNQADLLVRAQQSYITQKENRNEEAFVYDRNSSLYVGIRDQGSVRSTNSEP
jgi:hypothetical protein